LHFQYPYEIAREGASCLVYFPDVPGAVTQVDPGEDFDALVRDCLVAALGGYVEQRLTIPRPSAPRGRPVVSLDIMTSAKLALAAAMTERGTSNVALAAALGVSEKVVRRLLDLDHANRVDRLERALALFDRKLEVRVRQRPASDGPRAFTR
jgi:antitoxin HicB